MLLQFLQSVTIHRGLFKVELLRRLTHLLFHLPRVLLHTFRRTPHPVISPLPAGPSYSQLPVIAMRVSVNQFDDRLRA